MKKTNSFDIDQFLLSSSSWEVIPGIKEILNRVAKGSFKEYNKTMEKKMNKKKMIIEMKKRVTKLEKFNHCLLRFLNLRYDGCDNGYGTITPEKYEDVELDRYVTRMDFHELTEFLEIKHYKKYYKSGFMKKSDKKKGKK